MGLTNLKNNKLRFTPKAWAKYVHMRDMTDNEVGAFGVCEDENDPLLITELHIPKQEVTSVTVEMDDDSINEMIEDYVDEGLQPNQCGRIWLHTHPDIGATPSGVDEKTFKEVFGEYSWAIMGILAKGGETYARLHIGPQGQAGVGDLDINIDLTMEVDYTAYYFEGYKEAWDKEYKDNVKKFVQPYLGGSWLNGKWVPNTKTMATPATSGVGYGIGMFANKNKNQGGTTTAVTTTKKNIVTPKSISNENINTLANNALTGQNSSPPLQNSQETSHLIDDVNDAYDKVDELNGSPKTMTESEREDYITDVDNLLACGFTESEIYASGYEFANLSAEDRSDFLDNLMILNFNGYDITDIQPDSLPSILNELGNADDVIFDDNALINNEPQSVTPSQVEAEKNNV